jgi:hypothetical protein
LIDEPSRANGISRRRWLLATLVAPVARVSAAEPLAITFDGDTLHVGTSVLHFLSGKPLERLKDGATVVFLSQLTIFSDRWTTPFRRAPVERFVVSYDIWAEDKFSVTMPASNHSASNLHATALEAWCLGNLGISAAGLAPDRQFWLRLEMRTADQGDLASVTAEPGISLRNFILLLGRKPGTGDPQWTREAGPLRLADLTRTGGRGTRNG